MPDGFDHEDAPSEELGDDVAEIFATLLREGAGQTAKVLRALGDRATNPDEKLRDAAGAAKILGDVTATLGTLLLEHGAGGGNLGVHDPASPFVARLAAQLEKREREESGE